MPPSNATRLNRGRAESRSRHAIFVGNICWQVAMQRWQNVQQSTFLNCEPIAKRLLRNEAQARREPISPAVSTLEGYAKGKETCKVSKARGPQSLVASHDSTPLKALIDSHRPRSQAHGLLGPLSAPGLKRHASADLWYGAAPALGDGRWTPIAHLADGLESRSPRCELNHG
jgi:hypothetical protein